MGFSRASFLSPSDPATLVVYGRVSEPGRVLAELERSPDASTPLSSRHAMLGPAVDDLRLSSPGWIDITFEQRMTLTSSADLFQFCRSAMSRSISQFAKPIRQFVDAYLDFVWEQADLNTDGLEGIDPGDEVYGPADWVFSAWLPLPQAHILLPPEFERDPPQFAEVDMAFWQGRRLMVVLIEDARTPIKSKQRRLNYLREYHPHLDVVAVPRARIADGGFPADMFPAVFSRYWEGLPLPTGPAPPTI